MQHVIEKARHWCKEQSNLKALGIIGSYARGEARPDSDLDLVIVTDAPSKYLDDTKWITAFGATTSLELEDWGLVQSWRAVFEDGCEVEFCITTVDWCSDEQINNGTGRVVSKGLQVIHDPFKLLENLLPRVKEIYSPSLE